MSVWPRRLSACAATGLAFLLASCSNSNPAAPATPPAIDDHSGMYTLTITASDAAGPCTSTFPPAAKRRVYTARIQQQLVAGSPYNLKVFLSGADFVVTRTAGDSFPGTVRSTGAIDFRILDAYAGDVWWPFPTDADVVERLSDGTELVVFGDISARRTGSTISGQGGTLNHGSGGRCAIESFELVRR